MMRQIFFMIPILFLGLRNPAVAQAGEPLAQAFGAALSQGDIGGLTTLLDEEVELQQPGDGGKYLKQVVSKKLADFFKKNPPLRFTLKHQGSSADGQLYAIGQLTTQSGAHYKVLVRAKPAGAQYRIFKIDLLQP